MAWIIAYALAKKVQRTAVTIPLTTNLDFGGYRGINVGTPVNPNDISRKTELDSHNISEAIHGLVTGEYLAKTSRSDQLVSRDMMEYPLTDVNFSYLAIIGKLAYSPIEIANLALQEVLTDKAIESIQRVVSWATVIYGRLTDLNNWYRTCYNTGFATADFFIQKKTAGTPAILASEAVDLATNDWYRTKCSISGTLIEGYRVDMVTPKVSVTDTDHASGYFGIGYFTGDGVLLSKLPETFLRSPSSEPPRVLAYFEVPIIGTGTNEDPFRPQMPEELTTHPELGVRNLLAMSHASLIPTDPTTGKPIHGTALVRIFEQPDRDPTLRDIPTCLGALRAMTGVVELTRDDALRRARELDDKLHLFDLVRIPTPVKDQIKEYIEWRRTVHKVEMPEEVARRFLESDKGW